MNIRSVTAFVNPGNPPDEKALSLAGKILHGVRLLYEAAGFEVQSTRLATPSFAALAPSQEDAVQLARTLEERASAYSIDYVSLGAAPPTSLAAYAWIPAILQATSSVFVSGIMANGGKVYPKAALECAKAITKISAISPDGFGNLRFAALANVPPFTPFFPAAYAPKEMPKGTMAGFSIAVEAAPVAVRAFQGARNVPQAQSRLAAEIGRLAEQISRLGSDFAARYHSKFLGIDFSFAPFPQEDASLGTALEQLGVKSVGEHGSLAAAAITAAVLDVVEYPHAGFNGLMLAVLEDATLARRAAEGKLGIKDLLLLSAVCGTGLDTVPLPGDVSAEQVYGVLLDVAALSTRLDKPLTARLLPIPGKQSGEKVHFKFPYFVDSVVIPLEASGLSAALAAGADFAIPTRGQETKTGG